MTHVRISPAGTSAGMWAAVLVLAGLLLPFTHTQAQDAPQDRGRRFFEQLREDLSLTADQERQIREIMKESREKGEAIREQYAGKPDDMRSAMREHMKELRKSINGVLDAEQQEKFREMSEERMKTSGDVPGSRRHPADTENPPPQE